MRPKGLTTGIFLDSGNPADTREFLELLGFLDGQTTNPTLVARNPDTARLLAARGKTQSALIDLYKSFVREISEQIPKGSVSIEVYADESTTADAMFAQAQEMYGWIPNAHIKFPTTAAGLECAQRSIAQGMRVKHDSLLQPVPGCRGLCRHPAEPSQETSLSRPLSAAWTASG